MKQKLFENVGGNQFKLITESVEEVNPKAKLVREGLKKVFSSGDKKLSYKRLQGVGLGYIKSVEEAKKTAIQEARELAKEYGYMDNENAQAFVKEAMTGEGFQETSHDEVGSGASEKREVQIGNQILAISRKYGLSTSQHDLPEEESKAGFDAISELAQELIDLHTGKAVTKPGTGGVSYKAGSIY